MLVSASLGALGIYRYYHHVNERFTNNLNPHNRKPPFWRRIWCKVREEISNKAIQLFSVETQGQISGELSSQEGRGYGQGESSKTAKCLRSSQDAIRFARARQKELLEQCNQKPQQEELPPPQNPTQLLTKRPPEPLQDPFPHELPLQTALIPKPQTPKPPIANLGCLQALYPPAIPSLDLPEQLTLPVNLCSPPPKPWQPIKAVLVYSEIVDPKQFGFERSEVDWTRKGRLMGGKRGIRIG